MPTARGLDVSSATWLAGLDPALSSLPGALPPSSEASRWRLHDVHWTPGRGSRLAYEVRSSRSPPTFVAVDVTSAGSSRHDYREDAGLPGLSTASDRERVGDLLARLFDQPIRHCRVTPVRYRPGSRCVLRYEVETDNAHQTLYAKVFRPDRFTELSAVWRALAGRADGPRLVPELRGLWPGLQTMVGAAVPGRAVSAVLGDPTVPVGQRARLAHRLGVLLATFHQQRDVPAARWSATDQVTALTASLTAPRSVDAGLADRMEAVLGVLSARLPAAGVQVLGHGGFRAGQVVLADDGRLVVLDTDGVCRCDPSRDLGMVLAHLRWQGARLPEEASALQQAGQALLVGYESRAGRLDPDTLAWWRAVALLQVAVRRYHRLEIQHWPSVPRLVETATEILAAHRSPPGRGVGTNLQDPDDVELEPAGELASARGRRTVVRYTLRGPDRDPIPVVGKAFTEASRARLLLDHLRCLSDGPFRAGDLHVPEPVAFIPEQRMVVYRHCDGTPLDQVTDPATVADGVRRAARWLARLHTSDVRLPRTFSLRQEEESTRCWAVRIGQLHPGLGIRSRGLADRWVRAARSAGRPDEVPIHKDFHPGHVLVGDNLCVIDLDEARQGDPAFDLAHFCSYVELGRSDWDAGSVRAVFLETYARETGWTDRGTFAPYCAYAWLKIAKQWAVGSGPCREAPAISRVVEIERALAKGEQCLSE